ncbi:restriction endonuclease subunit S [Vibrio parahaemolyticus]|uniref:restriction endonuclease subunit S n=1 Tax=Vibrio parahaemolyticus TaxID=670 RepID=UPI001EEB6210|nr:restriction endonuclease subunit S [Vibrio parahaemolyticus]MCG6479848.1 restriction endonuclease subunit S [Vibrio parahaemolyticus]HCG6764783.1 restriction endonuclease subunit S [Vibrio parahaemolyticus]
MLFNASDYNGHWEEKKLSELGTFKRGKSKHRPRNDPSIYVGGGYPLVQTGQIKSANLYVTSHKQEYNEEGLKQSHLWPKNTLCITIAANIAETAILGYPMCFPDSIVGFNAYKGVSSEEFMHYIFTFIKKTIQNSASGSIQDNINIDYLTGLKFRIPDITYQNKIVEVLSSIDEKIDINHRMNDLLDKTIQSAFSDWFINYNFPNKNNAPYAQNEGEFNYCEEVEDDIPKEWSSVTLNWFIKTNKTGDWGKEEPEGNYTDPVYCIRGADIKSINGMAPLDVPERYILRKNAFKKLEFNDIIIEISGGSPTQSTGRIALMTEKSLERFSKPVICSNFCKVLSLKDQDYTYFFYCLWNHLYNNDVFFDWEGKTSGIKNLLFDSLIDNYHVVLPKKETVRRFSEYVEPMFDKMQINLRQIEEYRKMRDWLLPLLMSGQVTFED